MSRKSARAKFEREEAERELLKAGKDNNYNFDYTGGDAGRLAEELRALNVMDRHKQPKHKEYSSILKDLKEISEIDGYLNLSVNKQYMDTKTLIRALADIFQRYKDLSRKAEEYLDVKNPSNGTDSERRYIKVLRVRKHVAAQMLNLGLELQDLSNKAFNEMNEKNVQNFKNVVNTKRIELEDMFKEGKVKTERVKTLEKLAFYMAMVEAKCKMTDQNSAVPEDETLKKTQKAYLSSGLAEAVLSALEKNGFEKLTDNRFIVNIIHDKATELKKNQEDKAKVQEEKAKAPAEEAKREQERAGLKAEYEKNNVYPLQAELWGLKSSELNAYEKNHKSKGLEFSVSRSAVQTIAAGLMLLSKNPVYTMDEVFDFSKNQEARASFGRKAFEMVKTGKYKEIHTALYTVGRKTTDYINGCMKKEQKLSPVFLSKPENGKYLKLINVLMDANQEIERYEKKDRKVEKLLDEGLAMTAISSVLKPGAEAVSKIRFTDDIQNEVINYMTGNIACNYLNHLKKGKESEDIWNIKDNKKMNSFFGNIYPNVLSVFSKSPALQKLEMEKYREQIAVSMENGTFAEMIGLKAAVGHDGFPKIAVDEKLICKNFGLQIAQQKSGAGRMSIAA